MSVLIDRVLFNNELYQKLTPWERDFLRSMSEVYRKRRSFTSKQKKRRSQNYRTANWGSEPGRLVQPEEMMETVFLDTATTGLDDDAQVVEIAIVDSTGAVLFESLVKPTVPVDPEAAAIHGIGPERLASAPAWPEVSEQVRAALASSVGDLAPALGRDATVARVLPVLLALLRDANAEVRLNIISNLGPVHAVVGVDLLSQSLLPAIVDLADDAKWRVRGAIIEHVPLIADQLGVAFFDDALKYFSPARTLHAVFFNIAAHASCFPANVMPWTI